MSDLVSRLLAAIEETERVAQETAEVAGSNWRSEDCDGGQCEGHISSDRQRDLVACQPYEGGGMAAIPIGPHVARNDPAAVLRRCAADRTILRLHRPLSDEDVEDFLYPEAKGTCLTCGPGDSYQTRESGWFRWPCSTMKALASGYDISVEEETTGE